MSHHSSLEFDLFSIGTNKGSLLASKLAGSKGLRVGIAAFASHENQNHQIDKTHSVYSGTEPKKLLHYSSQLGDYREDQVECGFGESVSSVHNWHEFVKKLNDFQKETDKQLENDLVHAKVKIFHGVAKIVGPNTIEIVLQNHSKLIIKAKHIIVGIDSTPVDSQIPGANEFCIDSQEVFHRYTAPGKCLVIGNSSAALESAGFLRGLGYSVNVLSAIEGKSDIDSEMEMKIKKYMTDFSYIDFVKGNIKQFGHENGKTKATWTNETGQEETGLFETIIITNKRHFNYEAIGFENVGIKVNGNGQVDLDQNYQTSVAGVFVLNGLNSKNQELSSIAQKRAVQIVEQIINGNPQKIDLNSPVVSVFTPLEYSYCGMTEEEAILEIGADDIDVYYTSFKPLEWNFSDRRKKQSGFTKVIVNVKFDKILGIHYLGPNAADIIQGYAIIVKLGLGLSALSDTVGIHPTTAEELVNLKLRKRDSNPDDQAEAGC